MHEFRQGAGHDELTSTTDLAKVSDPDASHYRKA
jgi:hypothetical protein